MRALAQAVTYNRAAAVAELVAAARACAQAARAATHVPGDGASESDDDGEDEASHGPPLCDCEFSLAYGGKILLSSARLRLRPGARYGLCGANGCGSGTNAALLRLR